MRKLNARHAAASRRWRLAALRNLTLDDRPAERVTGASPASASRMALVGYRLLSSPISASRTAARIGLTPGKLAKIAAVGMLGDCCGDDVVVFGQRGVELAEQARERLRGGALAVHRAN